MEEPVLVSGTDGVGTKQRIAQLMGKHDTVGIDCVAMCVNDIICCGARPLFFLDYIAIGKNEPEKVAALVAGVAEGCVQAGCALIGGETAEHPGTMQPEDYDLAGFSVGIVDRKKILNREDVQPGDLIFGLPSSGIHSNGFSLVRKVFDVEHADLGKNIPELGRPLGEALLVPTRIYVRPVLEALKTGGIVGISHITGGGFYENIPRCLPDGVTARIEKSAVPTPPIFRLIQEMGRISERDMFNTFNMGIGMSLVVRPEKADAASCWNEAQAMRKAQIAVLVSGGGTNLQALLDAQKSGILQSGEISLVIANNPKAYALKRAERAGVRHLVLTGAEFEARLEEVLRESNIDLIILAGFMRILSAGFTANWPNRILNVHPALPPSAGKASTDCGSMKLRWRGASRSPGLRCTLSTKSPTGVKSSCRRPWRCCRATRRKPCSGALWKKRNGSFCRRRQNVFRKESYKHEFSGISEEEPLSRPRHRRGQKPGLLFHHGPQREQPQPHLCRDGRRHPHRSL